MVLALMAFAPRSPLARADDHLILLGGDEIVDSIQSIGLDGAIALEKTKKPLNLMDLRSIKRPTKKQPRKPLLMISLVGGGMLMADRATLENDICSIDWTYGKKLLLPIDAIRAFRFVNSEVEHVERSVDAKELEDTEAFGKLVGKHSVAQGGNTQDQLFIIVEGRVRPISGVFQKLGPKTVDFEWREKKRSIPCEKIFGLVLALVGNPPDHSGHCHVELNDGSSLWGKVLSYSSDKLLIEIPQGTQSKRPQVALPWDAVVQMTVRNNRLALLSDLDPVEVDEQVIVALKKTWKRDRSVMGRRLSLDGKTFEKGLGVHSRCSLTFDKDKQFDLFAATIGIDDETGGIGDCIFVVLGDGKELFKQRVRAKDKPTDLRINVSGYQQITLLVEPGEDLDLSDHADWCDARFISEAASTTAAKPSPTSN